MTAAKLTNNSNLLADIGTDHAYLPAYLILNNKCRRAIASDIRPGPLKRAKATAEKYGLTDKISLRLGAGLDTIEPSEKPDTIVIAGMGGLVISEILENALSTVKSAKKLILQPMTMAPELREFLYKSALGDITEHLAFEGDKIYVIISVDINKNAAAHTLTRAEAYIGKSLLDTRPDGFDRYAEHMVNKLKNKIRGLKCGETDEAAERLKEANELLQDVYNLINNL